MQKIKDWFLSIVDYLNPVVWGVWVILKIIEYSKKIPLWFLKVIPLVIFIAYLLFSFLPRF